MFAALLPASIVAGSHFVGFAVHSYKHSGHFKEITMTNALAMFGIAAYETAIVGVTFGLAALGFCPLAAGWADGNLMQIGAVALVAVMVIVVGFGLYRAIKEERNQR